MRKKLLTLLAGFMALTASAETVVNVDLNQITSDNASAVTDGVTVTSGRKSSATTYFDGTQLRFYAKDVLTISSEYDILAVRFTSTTTKDYTLSNLTCSTTDYSYTTDPATITTSTTEVIYNLTTPVKSIVFVNGSTKQTRINTLSVTIAAEPDTRNEVTLSWPEKQYDAVLENGFTAPTLSVDPEAAKGEVVYSSSDESVATIDANGVVTLVGTGLTEIKAAISDSETYKNASAEYALTVTSNNRENPFTIAFKKGTNKDGAGDLNVDTNLSDVILVGAQYINSITNASGTVKYQSTNGIRIGASSSAGSVTFKLDQLYVISKIVLGFAPYNTKDNGTVTVNSVEQNFSSSDMPAELVYEYTDKKSVDEIVITTGGSNKRALISSITVYYEEGNQASAELAFANNEYTAFLGAAFTSPKATTVSNGQITYTSSNTDVATVDEQTGDVTVLAVGSTVITASVAETEEFLSGEAEYALTVVDPAAQLPYYVSALGADFTFEQAESYPWSHDKTYGLKGSGFVKGAVVACDGLAISPVIDLSVCVDPVLDFQQAFNNYKIDNVMIDVADFNGYAFVMVKEEGDADWSELAVPTAPDAFSWSFYPNEQIDLGAYAGKKIQIAFKYVSTEECAGTWEIKNITVSAITDLAILINGERPTDQSFDENTEITLTAPAGAVIYYAWVANDPSVMADANAVDSYDWIEAPSNPYTMTVGNHKGELLKVRSTASDDKIAQLLFPEDGVVTRIESVVADGAEAPAEWFDLQGRRVAEPANGLYIRRQGRTATKVLVK